MNFFYVIVFYDESSPVVFPCKTKLEAKQLAYMKRQLFPQAEIIICKALYSELKVKVKTID